MNFFDRVRTSPDPDEQNFGRLQQEDVPAVEIVPRNVRLLSERRRALPFDLVKFRFDLRVDLAESGSGTPAENAAERNKNESNVKKKRRSAFFYRIPFRK